MTPPNRPKWDVTDIDTWGPDKHELGATIPTAGNSDDFETGGWRSQTPDIDTDKCTGCMLCYFYCPDASIVIKDGKAVDIDLKHCKGAKECPAEAIVMKTDQGE
jgi:pyruvate ferredoxin oxidoreductase delta subunit